MTDDISDFLEKYVFFPIAFRFENDGTVLVSEETYDPELIDFLATDRITISAHYHIKGGIIEIVAFIGDPISFKISKSGSGFTLEPTEKTMEIYNDDLAGDTKLKLGGCVSNDFMDWTKATYQKR